MIMKSNYEALDTFKLPEGAFVELYTPAAGRIRSVELGNVPLQFAKMILGASGSVTFKGYQNSGLVTFTLPAGPQPFLVCEITASAVPVLIVHDGRVQSGDESSPSMTADLPRV